MPRVTTAEVKAVIETALTDVDSFISTADLLIDEELVGKGLTNARLVQISLYLSAHFVSVRERQATVEKMGDASTTFNENAWHEYSLNAIWPNGFNA